MRQPVPFGKYLLLDRISVGGMAEVFKAKSYGVEGFEKVIAIKRILPSMGEDRDFIKMFIDEAKIAGQLSHANICQIFELGKIGGSHFIAMEYIWGKDLLQIQNREKRLGHVVAVPMACYIIAKACEGLHYAHKKRDPMGTPLEIVHRDCSPQNILISYEGEVKVIDFGIARAASRSSRTQAGVLKGKFGYMSPEQVRGLPLDRRSDIFSLGTVLYESLTGERLFVGESDFSTLEKVRNADVTPPRHLNKDIPEEVERIVLKALARDREKRYQWCSEMQADLQSYLTAQPEVFASKSLGEAIREMFSRELAREKAQLEQYKRVGRDGLISGHTHAEAETALEIDEELGEAPPLEGDPTVLGGPDFDELFGDVETNRPVSDGLRASAERDIAEAFEEHPTEIFGESGGGPPQRQPAAAAGRPTIAHSAAPPPAVAGALSPRAFDNPQPPRPPPAGTPPRSAMGSQRLASASDPPPPGPPIPHPGTHPGNHPASHPGFDPSRPLHRGGPAYPVATAASYPRRELREPPHTERSHPRLRRRGHAVRDIAIGVGIAALVLAAFAIGRSLLAGDDGDDGDDGGAIAVRVDGVESAEVLVDGEPAGKVVAGDPLMLAVAAGPHELEIRGDGVEPCKKTVEVTGGAVSDVACKLEAPAPPPAPDAAAASANPVADAGVAPAPDASTAAHEPPEDEKVSSKADRDEAAKRKREKRLAERREREKKKREERERERREKREREKEKREKEQREVGWLVCNSSPFARVLVDGRKTGKVTPMSKAEKIALSPGHHRVTFVPIGSDKKFNFGVTIVKGKTKTLYRVLKVE